MTAPEGKKVLFVCEHGALRCRIAAAYFDEMAPAGWSATTAGVDPQEQVSERLQPLMAGTEAEDKVDTSAPRSISEATATPATRTITIDTSLDGAEAWRTGEEQPLDGEALRDEIRERVAELVRDLGEDSTV